MKFWSREPSGLRRATRLMGTLFMAVKEPTTTVRLSGCETTALTVLLAPGVVLNGGTYIASALTKDVLSLMVSAGPAPHLELTSRQREVLRLVVQGQRAKEIAQRLDLTTRSVEMIKYRLMQLLDVHSTAQLVRCAVEHRLVPF